MDKLRLFHYYSICVGDTVSTITFELRQPSCDRTRYEELSRTFCDNVTELVGEIRFMTEECVLPVSVNVSVSENYRLLNITN